MQLFKFCHCFAIPSKRCSQFFQQFLKLQNQDNQLTSQSGHIRCWLDSMSIAQACLRLAIKKVKTLIARMARQVLGELAVCILECSPVYEIHVYVSAMRRAENLAVFFLYLIGMSNRMDNRQPFSFSVKLCIGINTLNIFLRNVLWTFGII